MKELLFEVVKSIGSIISTMYKEVTYFMGNCKNKNL